jgi:hypothetical protein
LKKFLSYLLLFPLVFATATFLVLPITQANTPLTCNMSTITGDDDGSFEMNLPFTLKLGPTEYNKVYYSTNATVTFGQPDGTFHDYPQTPSVSVAGRDWVSFGPGAYTSYGYNQDSFCIEWSVRPFPQSSGPLTQMRLVVNKFPNGNWHGEITTMTELPPDARRAIRYEYGQPVVTMEAAFDVGNGGIPVEVEPAPTPSSFDEPIIIPTPVPSNTPQPEPTTSIEPSLSPEPTPTPDPTQSITPIPEPTQSQSPEPTIEPSPQPSESSPEPSETVVQPSETPSPTPAPSLSPSESPLQPEVPVVTPSPTLEPQTSSPEPLVPDSSESPSPDPSPSSTEVPSDNNIIDGLTAEESAALNELLTKYGPMDAISFEDFEASGLDYEDLPPDQPVMLDNGVILTAAVADAIEMFENPSELLLTVLTDPGKALKAFANVGADMTPEQRKESQIVVVASIIVGQIISTTNLITGRIR